MESWRGRGRQAGRDALARLATAWKADLIVRKARPFSVQEMGRRTEAELLGAQVFVASAEDTLIAKLEWAGLGGGSELQLRDASGIVQLRAGDLDRVYVERWIKELGLEDLWRRVGG